VRDDAPLDTIAIIGCAVATGIGAVENTAEVQPGSTVAVIGCGGVGLSCIQGARLAQASRIVAVDINAEKLAVATSVGATDTLHTADVDPVAAMRELEPGGFDYVFDAIGKTVTTEQAIEALGQGGAAVIVGLPPTGSTARFDPLALAEANQRILGSNYGSIDAQRDVPRLVDLYMDGKIELDAMISGRRPLDDAADALDELAAGRALRTLLMIDDGTAEANR
jgi:S-(hydroxymethyl)glutathione dehydrogenase / alcohol dehydrogenase